MPDQPEDYQVKAFLEVQQAYWASGYQVGHSEAAVRVLGALAGLLEASGQVKVEVVELKVPEVYVWRPGSQALSVLPGARLLDGPDSDQGWHGASEHRYGYPGHRGRLDACRCGKGGYPC